MKTSRHFSTMAAATTNFNGLSAPRPKTLNTLNATEIEQLVSKTPHEIISLINCNRDLFNKYVNGPQVNRIGIIFDVMLKACQCRDKDMLYQFLDDFLDQNATFLNSKVFSYLLQMERDGLNEEILRNIENLVDFFKNLQKTHPLKSVMTSQLLFTPIRNALRSVNAESREPLLSKLDVMEGVRDELLNSYNFVYHGVKAAKEAPDDFRQIPIFPDKYDLIVNTRPFLRPNIVEGRYANANHYLDVQFRLLREDFVRPLREGIAAYLETIKTRPNYNHRLLDVRVYQKVTLENMAVTDDGDVQFQVKFDSYPFRNVQWETSKRLIYGALVCLTHDDFKTLYFGTVADRQLDKIKNGEILIKFEKQEDIIMKVFDRNFTMVESEAYFEASRHTLLSLQNIDENNFPMREYIVEVRKNVEKPDYLQQDSVYCLGNLCKPTTTKPKVSEEPPKENPTTKPDKEWLQNVKPKNDNFGTNGRVSKSKNKHRLVIKQPNDASQQSTSCCGGPKNKPLPVRVFDDKTWPSAEELDLDPWQYAAFKSGLRQKLCVIQGPPGTGKTHIGLKIMAALIHNKQRWNTNPRDEDQLISPILVVCYTNHALDQFMEGVLKITNKIVRVGGRSSSETLQPYSMNVLKRVYARDIKMESEYLLEKRVFHEKRLKSLNDDQVIHSEIELQSVINPAQLASLKEGDDGAKYGTRIKSWLRVEEETIGEEKMPEEDGCVQMDLDLLENGLEPEDFDDRYVPVRNHVPRRVINLREPPSPRKDKVPLKIVKPETNGTMSEKELLSSADIWSLDLANRWKLYEMWLRRLRANIEREIRNLERVRSQKLKVLQSESDEIDILVAKDALVVGMTTTGASKYRNLVANLKSKIVVVEEAAEVLEAHIVTSLSPFTRHLILIGDHQQLRPNPVVYDLAKKYNLDISLFERLIKNGVPYSKLRVQHRMRPEISKLLVPHIYDELENHQSVCEYPEIMGFEKSVYFVNHEKQEYKPEEGGTSRANLHEAEFLVALTRYVIQQGYKPGQITILTTYSGQLVTIKNLVSGPSKGIRANVVDNYQGEENDIILLSLVRSNLENDIGFLKTENRICVALSRAKIALFCVGNFKLLAQESSLWEEISHVLKDSAQIGPSLKLKCQRHSRLTRVTSAADFERVRDGGCAAPCDVRMPCGHKCPKKCHPLDDLHDKILCVQPCQRSTCQHKCPKTCGEVCDLCEVKVTRLANCGQTIASPCHAANLAHKDCKLPCSRVFECGHKCFKSCQDVCDALCQLELIRVGNCGQKYTTPCHALNASHKNCQRPCAKIMACGHKCSKMCREDCDRCEKTVTRVANCGESIVIPCHLKNINEAHGNCDKPCAKILTNGHKCTKTCSQDCDNREQANCEESHPVPCHGKDVTEVGLHVRCHNPREKIMTHGQKCDKPPSESSTLPQDCCEVVPKIVEVKVQSRPTNENGQLTRGDSRDKVQSRPTKENGQLTRGDTRDKVQSRPTKENGQLTRGDTRDKVQSRPTKEKGPLKTVRGHACDGPKCAVEVALELDCGHKTESPCYASKHTTNCQVILECGHKCIGERRLRSTCVEKCRRKIAAPIANRSIAQINNWLSKR